MRKILQYFGAAILLFLVITGGFIFNMEYIPDNAKIYVIDEYQTWIPDAIWVDEIYLEQASHDINASRTYDNRIETTYTEVKKGKYKGYQLPESWREKGGESRIFYGKKESILRSWIFPKENRWDEEGNWSY